MFKPFLRGMHFSPFRTRAHLIRGEPPIEQNYGLFDADASTLLTKEWEKVCCLDERDLHDFSNGCFSAAVWWRAFPFRIKQPPWQIARICTIHFQFCAEQLWLVSVSSLV